MIIEIDFFPENLKTATFPLLLKFKDDF